MSTGDPSSRGRPAPIDSRPALPALLCVAGLVALVLIVFAGGYGYHRDELYFLVAARHLAWSYPDQGPLTPLVAHMMTSIAPDSLTVLRIPSALMTGCAVLLTGLISSELGGSARAQLIAAACAAVASFFLAVGHLLSTTTFDLLAWALVTWLVVRTIRTGDDRLWLVTGLVTGLALLNKPLIPFLLVGLAAGLLTAGPRRLLRSPWLWAGLLIAIVMWSPWLLWQNAHDWPQLKVSSSIAHGGSGSSQPRWALLPFQILLVSPVLAPVWIAGLLALARTDRLRQFRCFAVAWVVLVAIFLITGGKPYYLGGMFPVLLAAGAIRVDGWLDRGSPRLRRALLAAAILSSGVVSALIALPLLPAAQTGPVIAADGDVGETIGWPDFVRTVDHVYRSAGRPAVIFTSNYGEAGAVDRYGPGLGLPPAYSGHNGFGEWGPPPNAAGPVVVIGYAGADLTDHFDGCRLAARVTNAAGVNNDENGEPIDLCAATRRPWSRIWGSLRHLG
ncbi:MAG TPA: glycosyltransferase family 39 protein [Solirubrobacteraceae bacterium]|nr:glycosyltransferase family 39 protein [Solirubrobacteraceae bacterium]